MPQPPFVMSKYASREDLLEAKANYYRNLLAEVKNFLSELPEDLGKGSLNGWQTQLQHKINEVI